MIRELTAFQRDLLRIVDGLEDPHGLAVKDEIEAYYGEQVHHGRLYPNLDTLVDEGLIEKGQKDRRTNRYTITTKGRQAISDRDSWNAAHHAESPTPSESPASAD